jgi:hypothetical protein
MRTSRSRCCDEPQDWPSPARRTSSQRIEARGRRLRRPAGARQTTRYRSPPSFRITSPTSLRCVALSFITVPGTLACWSLGDGDVDLEMICRKWSALVHEHLLPVLLHPRRRPFADAEDVIGSS